MNTLFYLFAFIGYHEFYVSTSYMQFNKKRQAVEVQKKVFFDDFEYSLREFTGDKYFDIINSSQDTINSYIEKYLLSNLSMKVNGKTYPFRFLGHEYKNGVINCFLEFLKIKKISTIEIRDTSLISDFEGQENLIYFERDNELKTLRIIAPKLTAKIDF